MDLAKLYQQHVCLIRIFARASISRWFSVIVLSQNIHPENSPFLLITRIDCSSGLVNLCFWGTQEVIDASLSGRTVHSRRAGNGLIYRGIFDPRLFHLAM